MNAHVKPAAALPDTDTAAYELDVDINILMQLVSQLGEPSGPRGLNEMIARHADRVAESNRALQLCLDPGSTVHG